MSELTFPELDAPAAAPAPRTEVATAASQAIDLEKIDLAAVALAQFGPWRDEVAEVRKKLDGVVHDLSTQAKIDEARSLRQRLINAPLAEARKVSAAMKSKLTAVSKTTGAELEAIVAAWDSAATLITPQIDEAQKKLDDAKAADAAAEAQRKADHEARLASISAYVEHCKAPGMTAARIQSGMDQVAGMLFTTEHWEEYAVRAADTQCRTLEAMRQLHAAAVAAEAEAAARAAEAARLEALRAEQKRIAEAQAETQRLLDEQAAAVRQQLADLEAARALLAAAEAEAKARADTERLAAEKAARLQALEPLLLDEINEAANDCIARSADEMHAIIVAFEDAAARLRATPASDAAWSAARLAMGNRWLQATEAERPVEVAPVAATGEHDHMLQDVCAGLSRALADKPDAMLHAREAAAAIATDDAPLETGEADAITPSPAVIESVLATAARTLTTSTDAAQAIATEARALVAHAYLAYARFPSNPKATPAWWAGLRTHLDRLDDALKVVA
jgi:hypothetical protein